PGSDDYLGMSERRTPITRAGKADDAAARARDQSSLYTEAVTALGSALERLARSYESDPSKRQDLLQDIHLNVWRSLARFDGRCSLRTWVYRVAHNVAASHVMSEHRYATRGFVGLDVLEFDSFTDDPSDDIDRERLLARLLTLIDRLRPLDRQLVTLY